MRTVIVGVDGAAAAERALDWSARTVGPDGVIHAVTAAIPLPDVAVDVASAAEAPLIERIQTRLDEWTEPFRDHVGVLTTHTDTAPAADAIRQLVAAHAPDAIVLGTHVPPRMMPRTLGRTLRELLNDLPCPLVVVPSGNRSHLDDGDPVVAGVGHGDATESAVRWAADLAADRDLPLGLVRATGEGPVFQVEGLLELAMFYIDPAQRRAWAREDVEEMARFAQESTQEEIEIGVSTVPGLPASKLVDLSGRACLLVIGRHRSPVGADRHLAQPLRHALTHARCPVVVVPAETSNSEATDDAAADP